MKKYSWMKIDTASIMFTCLSSKKWGRTFRMAVVFKDEDVNPEILKKAAEDVSARYPATHTTLKKGFFWNYQEASPNTPEIREEFSRPILPITLRTDGRPDFRLVYHKRRLGLECAHHIGDGKGASVYFNALLERYCELTENPDKEYVCEEVSENELSNAFYDFYQKGGEKAVDDDITAYRIPGEIEPGFLQMLFAMAEVDNIHKKAKERNLTITEFIASAVILGTIRHAKEPINQVISIAIPVNLRRFFETDSLRNFTVQSKIDFNPKGRIDWTFDEICNEVRGQLKERLTTENMQKTLNKFGALANNPVIRVVPNFIKLPVMRVLQHKSHSANTTIVTNTGDAEIPESIKDRIERVDGVNGDTSGYGLISTCSVCSGNGLINMCFSVCSHDVSWPKECIRAMAEQGIIIRLEGTNATEKKVPDGKEMYCSHCKTDLAETYESCPLCGEKATESEARIKGLKAAPYPKDVPVRSLEKAPKVKAPFTAEKIKAYFNT